ncbi:hypothetical protein [Actinacidiphila sp. ITFR-21]|uniref:hypothetical protein n=1 Tax=Actinacidiphila sp. ITFR-21 TaxID=3075199 RepID=UPI002888FDF1|nr:hypothetical protein [Streptomyces sp. ITFR-21]WNI18666.1 hypothetical protein RLT57_26140 [Streptomyces sp. ITFR-21]
MRARTSAAVLTAVAAAVLTAGCGSSTGGTGSGSGSATTPSRPAAGISPACGDAVVTPGGTAHEVCVGVGGTLRVRLGVGDRPATEKGAALTPVSPGVYRGARAGSAELSGFRRVCPGARPGGLSCHAVAGWQVTVRVR